MNTAAGPAAMPAGSPAPAAQTGILALLPDQVDTEHSIDVDGERLDYQARAGTLPIRDGSGKTTAEMFYVAYTTPSGQSRPGTVQSWPSGRPISFVFNGGPGAASAYLHLGGLGPRLVVTDGDGTIPASPAGLTDNPDTWLSFTDLVFVDPVGTGYSRAADPGSENDFWGVDRDRDTMAAFIRLYLARNGRTTSPVTLVGESYGGFRAAILAKSLPADSGVALSGLVLISPALDFSLLFGDETGDIMQPALLLPSLAAVRLLNGASSDAPPLDRDRLAARLAPAEKYALGDYLAALAAGPRATADRASGRIAELTGLPLDLVRKENATISASTFAKRFREKEGLTLSRYDGLAAGPDFDPSASFLRGPDPVLDRMSPIWTAAAVDYLRNELGYRTDVTYRLLEGRINGQWDYGNGRRGQGYADAMDELYEARALEPKMKVLIANGYSDLVTPYLISRFLVDQLPALAGAVPIRIEDYLGGHMMYLRKDSRSALRRDVEALYVGPTGSGGEAETGESTGAPQRNP